MKRLGVLRLLPLLALLAESHSSLLDGTHHDHHHHGNHNHHHGDHGHHPVHQDTHHQSLDHHQNKQNRGKSFVVNKDVFARALADEVLYGIFSPLPDITPAAPASSGQRGAARFETPVSLETRDKKTLSSLNNTKTQPRSNRKKVSARPLTKNLAKSFNSGNNQEILTPITSQKASQRSTLSRSTSEPKTSSSPPPARDDTGFAPRAPPPSAPQFDPFSSNKGVLKQQLSKFKFRSDSPSSSSSPLSVNSVHLKSSNDVFETRSASSAHAVVDSTGFAPVAPPHSAPQFDPVKSIVHSQQFGSKIVIDRTASNANHGKSLDIATHIPSDVFSLNYNTDYDNNAALTGATDQPRVSKSSTDSGAHAQHQQISVLRALSSTDNILNSPKYNSKIHYDSPPSGERLSVHTLAVSASTARPVVLQGPGLDINDISSTSLSSTQIGENIQDIETSRYGRIPSTEGSGTGKQAGAGGKQGSPYREAEISNPVNGVSGVSGSAASSGAEYGAAVRGGPAQSSFENSGGDTQVLVSVDGEPRTGRQLVVDANHPALAHVPTTSFRCADQRYGGYYADLETGCQAFHVCLSGRLMGSFLCPNGTLFQQRVLVCDWADRVRCEDAHEHYHLNARIGMQDDGEEDGDFGVRLQNAPQPDTDDTDNDDVLTEANYDTDNIK